MKLIAPDYYGNFCCIADKCKHSCCIGWEIDIDKDSLEFYSGISGTFGEKLKATIAYDGDTHHFKLAKGDRCPFLNEQGLCDIITELGEDALCNICADHPRFRNFFSGRTELGLGMCGEAAAKLILTKEDKAVLCELEDDGIADDIDMWDTILLSERHRLIEIAQDRSMPVEHRAQKILYVANAGLPKKSLTEYLEFYSHLERLDPSWDNMLSLLNKQQVHNIDHLDTALEQLLVYFLYRHIPSASDKSELAGYTAFAVLSYKLVRALCERTGADIDTLCEIARAYSCEIEYSEENTRAIVDMLMLL